MKIAIPVTAAVFACLSTFSVSSPARAQTAPAALYGKSVVVNWTETRMQRLVGETAFSQRAVAQSLSVYVSTRGQMFARRTAARKGQTGSKDSVGEGGASTGGGARVARFSGRTLSVIGQSTGGARSITVNFGEGFSGCTAAVILGRSGGQVMRTTSLVSGRAIEIQSATAGGESCSIQDGNVFGN